MPSRSRRLSAASASAAPRVVVRVPSPTDETAFLAAAHASRALHRAWVRAPSSPTEFHAYVARYASGDPAASDAALVALRAVDGAPVGVFNFSNIVRGAFRSAFLGYYAFAPLAGHGYMSEAMALVLDHAFGPMKLHRVEANVQPDNARSIALVERIGYTREGYSRRYIKIAGRWRDHVRYAMLAEDWRAKRRRVTRR
ncbi:MAG: GNAT family protein [Burkholderiales bacterium]